jgi:TetR/AcrR family transcriptional regulator
MGRRLTGRERRESIVASAARLFSRHGFSGVSTRAIAEDAGISEAMLFKHFPRKDGLYREILRRHLANLERVLPLGPLAASEEPPERLFREIADGMLRRMESDPTLLRLTFFSALEGHPMARDIERARARGLRAALARYLRRQHRGGRLRVEDPGVAARSFLWLVAGFAFSRTIFGEAGARAVPRRALARKLARQFLSGLHPSARHRGNGR